MRALLAAALAEDVCLLQQHSFLDLRGSGGQHAEQGAHAKQQHREKTESRQKRKE